MYFQSQAKELNFFRERNKIINDIITQTVYNGKRTARYPTSKRPNGKNIALANETSNMMI